MNKLLLITLLGFAVVVLSQNVQLQPYEADSQATVDARSRQTKCHESCVCESLDVECANCNKCSRCVQAEGTQIVNQDFCQCLTPEWVQSRGPNGEWQCSRVSHPPPQNAECEWQLFNQIYRMVVHSDCSLLQVNNANGSQSHFVVDVISFDWRRLSDVLNITDDCKNQITSRLLWANDCTNYVPLANSFYTQLNNNQLRFSASLMDVYSLTDSTQLSADGRTIYQRICLAVELGNARKVLRQHRFQIRVYTNRDQVEVFHLNVDKLYTEGCDKGQECIIVVNLDTEGFICNDASCGSFKDQSVTPTYKIGEHLYVRIQFKDTDYTKYLQVQTVKFIDDAGIYTYVRGVQWGVLRSLPAITDVDVYLFQPQNNAQVEVALKIALVADNVDLPVPPSALRALATSSQQGQTGDVTTQSFKNVTVEPANTNTNSAQLLCGLALAALALLF